MELNTSFIIYQISLINNINIKNYKQHYFYKIDQRKTSRNIKCRENTEVTSNNDDETANEDYDSSSVEYNVSINGLEQVLSILIYQF
jgi:hypothetical protein